MLRPTSTTPHALKIVIAGGFGAGKTTLVTAVSDLEPITTETAFSSGSTRTDDLTLVPGKQSTTVAMDFGRVDLEPGLHLYLFGTPGQQRFWYMWSQVVQGALGAVVLADSRRLADCFGAVDYFEANDIPYVVVINQFDRATQHALADLRDALAVSPDTPVLLCDARSRSGARRILIELVEHLIRYRTRRRELAAA